MSDIKPDGENSKTEFLPNPDFVVRHAGQLTPDEGQDPPFFELRTPLGEAPVHPVPDTVEQGLALKPTSRPNKWIKPVTGVAAALAIGIGAFVVTKSEDKPSEVPVAPSNEESETNTPNEAPSNEEISFNGYTPSVSGVFTQEEIDSGNLENYFNELLVSDYLNEAVTEYGLRVVDVDYGQYGGSDSMIADYAWVTLFPNTYIDTSSLANEPLGAGDIRALAPVYIHNYIMALNLQMNAPIFPEIDQAMPPQHYIYKPTVDTYSQLVTVTNGFDRASNQPVFTIEGISIPINVVDTNNVGPITESRGGTAPNEWEFSPLRIHVSQTTGQVVGYDHEAFELNT